MIASRFEGHPSESLRNEIEIGRCYSAAVTSSNDPREMSAGASQPKGMHDNKHIETLALREQVRDKYLLERDPIAHDRMRWRAQSFRHLVHLLPGESVLELGCGDGMFTSELVKVCRAEGKITAITFADRSSPSLAFAHPLEVLTLRSLPGPLNGRSFDYLVALDLLDKRNCRWFLQWAYDLLKPGGQLVFYESNPWNIVLRMRRTLQTIFKQPDPRALLTRQQLYDLMSEMGFIRVLAVSNDFVYAPLTPRLVWLLRNLSLVLENLPVFRALAGSLLIHAQKPPHIVKRSAMSFPAPSQLRNAVSVVIPCYNEAMNIGPIVTGLREFYQQYLHEIILVDDNSIDQTRDVIRQLPNDDGLIKAVFRSPPRGVGRAITDGYRKATGHYVLSLDCDFQHLLPEVRDLLDSAAEGYDMVVGSRFSPHSVLLNYPVLKIIANRGFHLLARLILRGSFRDLTNNIKLIRRSVVDQLVLREAAFAVNAEIGFQPLLLGYSIKEVPISWINRFPDMGTSSFQLTRVSGGYWRVLYYLWLNSIFGGGVYRQLSFSAAARTTSR